MFLCSSLFVVVGRRSVPARFVGGSYVSRRRSFIAQVGLANYREYGRPSLDWF